MQAMNVPADMRDIRRLREILDTESTQNALFRAEVRSAIGRGEDRDRIMLTYLERVVTIPAHERATLPLTTPTTWRERISRWLARPVSAGAMMASAALSGMIAVLTARVLLVVVGVP